MRANDKRKFRASEKLGGVIRWTLVSTSNSKFVAFVQQSVRQGEPLLTRGLLLGIVPQAEARPSGRAIRKQQHKIAPLPKLANH